MNILKVLGMGLFSIGLLQAESAKNEEPKEENSVPKPENLFHNNWAKAPKAGAFRMKDYIVWGGSVIKGKDDGRYYMFASRWPKKTGMASWATNSEVVLASADKAAGPYKFEKIVLPSRGAQFWDGKATCNPTVRYHKGKYILFYTGITYDFEKPDNRKRSNKEYELAWNNKRIGVAVSDSPFGPWKRSDQPILTPRPGQWDGAITSNAAPAIHDDGSVVLIYKSAPVPYPARYRNRAMHFGLARAKHYLGSYKRVNENARIHLKGMRGHVEDPYIWYADNHYHMLSKTMSTGAGFYAYSTDGLNWTLPANSKAYSMQVQFDDGTASRQTKLERPQLLFENGIPTHVFFATADPKWSDIYNLVIPLKNKDK